MPVHAQSQIQVWLNSYSPSFYTSLTNKEYWTYTAYPSELNAWKGQFSSLMGAINTWANHTYSMRTVVKTKGLISAIYMYRYLGSAFGTSLANLSQLEAPSIYNIGGFIPLTLSRSDNYYDDLVSPVPPATDPPPTSAKMDADIATLAPSVFEPVERTKIEEILDLAGESSAIVTYNALFKDLPTPSGSVPTKQDMANIIFTDLKFAIVKQYIPGVKGIDIPTYP